MTPVQAIFGIEAGTLNTIVQLVLLAVVVVWLALVWYTSPTPGGGSTTSC